MGRCGCQANVIEACSPNVHVSGNGSPAHPYCISVDEGGCPCFYEHKMVSVDGVPAFQVPLNALTAAPLTTITTVGSRADWEDNRSSMLVVDWTVNISDYSDGTMDPADGFGYGAMAVVNERIIGGSHGFCTIAAALSNWPVWAGGDVVVIDPITGVDSDTAALTSGSFTCFLNAKEPGPFPNRWDATIACYVSLTSPLSEGTASFRVDTYEYGLCACLGQE